jgi:hypothetical protein
MLTAEQTKQFSEIFTELSKELDISKSQHDTIVRRYDGIAKWLAAEGSPLYTYNPEIRPQGSFLLGTAIKPINTNDDIDIDLVCFLHGKKINWTQHDLKHVIGNQIKTYPENNKCTIKEGKRCWKIKYPDDYNFHLDVLPSIIRNPEQIRALKESINLSEDQFDEIAREGIKYTDSTSEIYETEANEGLWPVTNPFGYAYWFEKRSKTGDTTIKNSLLP